MQLDVRIHRVDLYDGVISRFAPVVILNILDHPLEAVLDTNLLILIGLREVFVQGVSQLEAV